MHTHVLLLFVYQDAATSDIYTLSLHDALPISHQAVAAPISSCRTSAGAARACAAATGRGSAGSAPSAGSIRRRRSEEHTSELQSQSNLVCRLLLEKKKKNEKNEYNHITKIYYT